MKLLPASPAEFLAPLPKPPETLFIAEVEGPFVTLVLGGTDRGLMFATRNISSDDFSNELAMRWGVVTKRDRSPLKQAIERFQAYFEGDPAPFGIAIQPFLTSPFTLEVHRFLTRIPFGGAMSYGEIAEALGRPGAARAVGTACGKNRVLIAVPCHRVLASNGLGGFGAGLEVKRRLLSLEGITYRETHLK